MSQNNPLFLQLWKQIDQHIKNEIARHLRQAGIIGSTINASYLAGTFTASSVSIPASGSKVMQATEAIAAGSLVNVETGGVRLASSALNRPASGFVLAAISSGGYGAVYSVGLLGGLSGLTVGATQFLSTGGGTTESVPTATGAMLQIVGTAVSATQIAFQPQSAIIL